jgi:hypothetical protein
MPMSPLDRLKARVSAAVSAAVCSVALVLPYAARQAFVFTLHFILDGLIVKLKILLNWISYALAFILFLPVYFVGLPVTLLLIKLTSAKSGSTFAVRGEKVEDDDVYRMF